jgi:hypothetical protein
VTGALSGAVRIRTPDQRLPAFDEVFAAGAWLNQQDAVAAVRDRHGEGARAS